jgi:uncharacterized membrane protein YcaP (DUF421 family)
MDQLWQGVQSLVGAGMEPKDVNVLQVCVRALLFYLFGWALLRIGGNRSLGRETAFDIVLGFVLGSTLSRGINGSSPILLALAASVVLVAVHRLLAWATFRSHRLGEIFKGSPSTLVRDGEISWEEMRRHQLTPRDLEEGLRLRALVADPTQVQEARFERNGQISAVKKKETPRVIEVRVEAGVQTVRIELG